MGARGWQYWRYVGGPVLFPSFLGGVLLLFGGSLSAYATAEALTSGSIALSPIQIGSFLNGNVIAGQQNVGKALGLGMVVVIAVVMVFYVLLAEKGLALVALIESPIDLDADDRLARSPRPWSSIRLRNIAWWRGIVLVLTGAFFLVPLFAALRFSLEDFSGRLHLFRLHGHSEPARLHGRSEPLGPPGRGDHRHHARADGADGGLRAPALPRLRPLFDSITILPIVIPPVVLIVGVLQVAPTFLKSTPYLLALEYTVLAMPFVYRSLDAGLRAIDLKTLVEASRSLGGGWRTTLWRVIVPNLRTGHPLGHRADRRPGARRVHHGQPRPLPDRPGVDRAVRARTTATSRPPSRCWRWWSPGSC